MSTQPVLRRHSLKHLPELRLHESVFSCRFAAGCSTARCNALCCKEGVWADLAERAKILAHVPLIQQHMDPGQEHRPEFWFEEREVPDADFPSGFTVGTRANEQGCVFLKSDGRCVLQSAAMASGMPAYSLKPFYCVAFPVTVHEGQLMMDEPDRGARTECCTGAAGGTLSVFDVCAEELRFVLGEEGVEELREQYEQHRGAGVTPV
jgi:Fe-S-cluster containining protein